MRSWLFILGGLNLWAAHFFAVYAIGSIFPGQDLARWLTAGVTFAALAIGTLLLRHSLATLRASGSDKVVRWNSGVAAGGSAGALLAIFYQGLPAVLG